MVSKIKQFKIARRLGARIFPKTENPKFILTRKPMGKKRRPKPLSEFGSQLLEKQKARFTYGVGERQFANYVKRASLQKDVNPPLELYRLLESRLDNVVFRLGFLPSRRAARQAVSHGHITIDGRKVTIPSARVEQGNIVGLRPQSGDKALFASLGERLKEHTPPAWLSLDEKKREGNVKGKPTPEEAGETLLNLTSVIEFYSR